MLIMDIILWLFDIALKQQAVHNYDDLRPLHDPILIQCISAKIFANISRSHEDHWSLPKWINSISWANNQNYNVARL